MTDFLASLLLGALLWLSIVALLLSGNEPKCANFGPPKPAELWLDKDTRLVLPFQTRSCISK